MFSVTLPEVSGVIVAACHAPRVRFPRMRGDGPVWNTETGVWEVFSPACAGMDPGLDRR